VAEGFHLLEEALNSQCEISAVLVSPEAEAQAAALAAGRARITLVDPSLFAFISSTETSQGAVVLVRPVPWDVDSLFASLPLLVVLDGIQDPGNAGTILRSAEAFGATGAVFLKGSVNPYNPKAIRASAGSVFRLPLLPAYDPEELLRLLAARGVPLLAATSGAVPALCGSDLIQACALAIGSEGKGVSARIAAAGRTVRIPTRGVESLNAAVAASILLYEASRQRNAALRAG
jgi:TrmH family RNA methyltransferase